MPTIVWNRTERDVVKLGSRALLFASSADADVWLARNALKTNDSKATKPYTGGNGTIYDKLTVT